MVYSSVQFISNCLLKMELNLVEYNEICFQHYGRKHIPSSLRV